MSERKQQYEAFAKFGIVFLFAALYALGGSGDFGGIKALRRFVAPIILCGACFWYSWDWRYMVQMPLMMVSLSLGYGSDVFGVKLLKRVVYGLANGASSSIVGIWHRWWHLVIIQILLCLGISVGLGVWGVVDARVEEFCFGVFFSFLPVMSCRKRS